MAKKPIKPKQCKVCEKPFIPTFSTLQVVCGIPCSRKFNEEKEIKKRVKQMKVESQKLSDLESVARVIFQKYIRERDKKDKCISCNRTETEQWDGSHLFSAEQYSGVIFNEMNVNKACVFCNRNLYGNLLEYRKGFILKYGEQAYNDLEKLANETRTYKFQRSELIDIANKYKIKLKELGAKC